jgi:hypothetical protein
LGKPNSAITPLVTGMAWNTSQPGSPPNGTAAHCSSLPDRSGPTPMVRGGLTPERVCEAIALTNALRASSPEMSGRFRITRS